MLGSPSLGDAQSGLLYSSRKHRRTFLSCHLVRVLAEPWAPPPAGRVLVPLVCAPWIRPAPSRHLSGSLVRAEGRPPGSGCFCVVFFSQAFAWPRMLRKSHMSMADLPVRTGAERASVTEILGLVRPLGICSSSY